MSLLEQDLESKDNRRADDERTETDSAADDFLLDGRMVGLPPEQVSHVDDEEADSPEKDAEIQSQEEGN